MTNLLYILGQQYKDDLQYVNYQTMVISNLNKTTDYEAGSENGY